ncbi:P-loop containing nucleoside triphosphate hydrolase protein [Radiomyces spectabilis]|uniref:P-loop containing nucleoside triphosphate hydrolase protein n=1 Tax=Radiomyces spectabilis TaxID=64574 RepID=UPI00222066E3|nr:P-loop containing nucleoside triphosphate hydrolase protein [Radiomyces spectabilis]KAI8391240.1 P-loop containing nucleoside triphosphate hydrolase protein [Radiomyces spectabilis]
MTSGLRQPQIFSSKLAYNDHPSPSPTSPSTFSSRLPQLQTASPTVDNSRYARTRRQSVIATQSVTPSKTVAPIDKVRTRNRTMSDASRLDLTALRSSVRDRKPELRRSLYLDQSFTHNDSNESSDEESQTRNYRASAPLLDAYGVPLSASATKSRSNSGLFKLATNSAVAASSQHHALSDLNQKIRVCVRKRPLNHKESEKGEKDIAPTIGTRSIQINEPKLKLDLSRYIEQHTFTFDDVFDADTKNANVYERTALPLVKYIFQGGKATCFAYGQTGSGKTFTMLDPKHGLYIMAARDIFTLLRKPENNHLSAWIGLYEIYQGQLYDLLNNRKRLFAREDGKHNVIIAGLKEFPIDNVDKLIQVFEYGSQVRSTGTTGANDSSSRSHAVLQILLKPKTNRKRIHGKLSFIDLAGSERGADRGEADAKTRMEGAEINKSLLALKECIRALDQDKRHTPFRQSKLTQVLKDSFVGNSRTCMIATISPGHSNSEHTLNTLRYADRVKELKGERDRRSQMEKTSSSSGNNADEEDTPWMMDTSAGDEDEDDEDFNEDYDTRYMQEDSNDELRSHGDSDILDDDTFNADEEDIFDVDFPHEQDAFIRSNTMISPSHKPIHSPAYHHVPSTRQSMPLPKDLEALGLSSTGKWSSSTIPDRGPINEPPSYTSPYSPVSTPQSPIYSASSRRSSLAMDYSMQSSTFQAPIPSTTAKALNSGTTNGLPQFDHVQMEEFVKFHRAEIREVTECTKKETKLVANISLDLSCSQDFADEDPLGDNAHMDISAMRQKAKSSEQFRKYLYDLEEILERKIAAIEALRDRINHTVTQVEM